jgi:alcohol dehydrogenase class IV
VDFNESVVPERVQRVGALFGAPAVVGACAAALRELRTQLGISAGLAKVGVKRDQLPRLAALALNDACHHQNPRPCSEADFRSLYEASL